MRWAIDLCRGLGQLRFGETQNNIRATIGEPTDIERFGDGDVHWSFRLFGITLFFASDDEGRLSAVEITSEADAWLFGRRLSEMHLFEVIELLKSNDVMVADPSTHTQLDRDIDEIAVTIRPVAATFYFDRYKRFRSLNYGVCVDAGDAVRWPMTSES